MPSHQAHAGFDFGTTNSSLAVVLPGGSVRLARFPYSAGETESYRSLLYFEAERSPARNVVHAWTGPSAIDRYLAVEEKGRLMQSLKSFLSSRSLLKTDVFGRQRTLEELIALAVRDIRKAAEAHFGIPIRRAVVGRPVRFVGSEADADDTYAQGRLAEAMRLAGFEEVAFEYEPVAAAYHYESTLAADQLIFIGDFGGGTSDFSILRTGPAIRKRGRRPSDLLANGGIGIAGDSFDAKIIRRLVSPALGEGGSIRSLDKILPVPVWVYRKLERWHHLSLLKNRETLSMLESVRAQAFEPERIAALLHLVRNDLGYRLHRSVQEVKWQLSTTPAGAFRFVDDDVYIEGAVTRTEFERWIEPELRAIEGTVDSVLADSGAAAKDIDCVFLTGGSSFVPAVRGIFEARFGAGRIRAGNEFTSVARGLALKAAEASPAQD